MPDAFGVPGRERPRIQPPWGAMQGGGYGGGGRGYGAGSASRMARKRLLEEEAARSPFKDQTVQVPGGVGSVPPKGADEQFEYQEFPEPRINTFGQYPGIAPVYERRGAGQARTLRQMMPFPGITPGAGVAFGPGPYIPRERLGQISESALRIRGQSLGRPRGRGMGQGAGFGEAGDYMDALRKLLQQRGVMFGG